MKLPVPREILSQHVLRAARHYFDKGRCSGHDQFNGRYCRDVAGPERWCIHCAGFVLLTAYEAEQVALQGLVTQWQEPTMDEQ